MNFRITHEALEDIDAVLMNEAEHSGWSRSMDVEAQLWRDFERLGQVPGIGHLRRDLVSTDVYFSFSQPYMIVYLRDTAPISIIAVLHGSRDIAVILNERLN
jgi:plasmid stabilization system protein ParE